MKTTRWAFCGATLLAAASAAGGCYLPIATGSPQGATTVGEGKMGMSVNGEAPNIDLAADDENPADTAGVAPAVAGVVGVAYGVTDNLDLEANAEGTLYLGFLPLPTGASLGARMNVHSTPSLDVAIAGRVGGVWLVGSDGETDEHEANAKYAAASITMQGVMGKFRPLFSLQAMGADIYRRDPDFGERNYKGFIGSATVGLFGQFGSAMLGPYVTGTYFNTDQFDGAALGSFGFMIAMRPDRHAPPQRLEIYNPVPPQPYPSPYPAPAQPYPSPYPAPAQPYPAPASPAPGAPGAPGAATPPPAPPLATPPPVQAPVPVPVPPSAQPPAAPPPATSPSGPPVTNTP